MLLNALCVDISSAELPWIGLAIGIASLVIGAIALLVALYSPPTVVDRKTLETSVDFPRGVQKVTTWCRVQRGKMPFFKNYLYRNRPIETFTSFDSALSLQADSGHERVALSEDVDWFYRFKKEKGKTVKKLFLNLKSPRIPTDDMIDVTVEATKERSKALVQDQIEKTPPETHEEIESTGKTVVTAKITLHNKSSFVIKDYQVEQSIPSVKELVVLGVWRLGDVKSAVQFRPEDPGIALDIPLPRLPEKASRTIEDIGDYVFTMYVDLPPGKTEINFRYRTR